MPTTVLWFRRDLRLADHPALCEAHQAAGGGRVLPLFVLDPALLGSAGSVRTACLSEAVQALSEATDGALVVRRGDPAQVVAEVAASVGAASVHISGETTPYGRRRDAAVRARLGAIPLVATGTPYAVGPGTLVTGAGTPYQVFTPFSRAWRDHGWPAPAPTPPTLRWLSDADGDPLPEPDHRAQAPRLPACSPQAAVQRWREFLEAGLTSYDADRDRPDLDGTSGLSMHLKYGTVHPRTLLADVARHVGQQDASGAGVRRFVTELCWREFYADVLWHRPDSAWADLRSGLAAMAYDDPGAAFAAWQAGRTGYPLVDAGQRQLLAEGWMHNRVRMVSASFLVKHLHVWWPHGARHFMRHLRDADLASNSHGWQWVAGTGTDAAPYFRVFNPVAQGRKFDPHGDYVRRYLPELAHLPGASVHEPWKAPTGYDHGYPARLVDHDEERREALRRYDAARLRA
ncbi:MAG: deoxyribodipyrimidine photo-lyase [Austwickia sp.]|nr:deoxyribodipyrimidine photo-lyase [Austwickia sp.]MBK8437517.1 deoxyribodipyrimidine photo-lyase [Austwickia sp.]MBK9102783.1 deoxyribodipyrimidine photo-lyase [Austwickia sp.]